jgi:hypothetical protein
MAATILGCIIGSALTVDAWVTGFCAAFPFGITTDGAYQVDLQVAAM